MTIKARDRKKDMTAKAALIRRKQARDLIEERAMLKELGLL